MYVKYERVFLVGFFFFLFNFPARESKNFLAVIFIL